MKTDLKKVTPGCKSLSKVVGRFSEAIGLQDSSARVTSHAKVESFPRDYESEKFPRWIIRPIVSSVRVNITEKGGSVLPSYIVRCTLLRLLCLFSSHIPHE